MGVSNQVLALNGVFVAQDRTDVAACALEARGRQALADMPAELATLPRIEVPLLPYAPMGAESLLSVFGGAPRRASQREAAPSPPQDSVSLRDLLDDLTKAGRGVLMTMGKGGVGKTTIASAVAIELARRGVQGASQHNRSDSPRFGDNCGRRCESHREPH